MPLCKVLLALKICAEATTHTICRLVIELLARY